MILAGDVGGTKVHLALYAFEAGRLKQIRDAKFPATQFATLDAVVETFLTGDPNGTADQDRIERDQIVAACFGVPGPVRDGRLKLTNLPWVLEQHALARSLGVQHIFLINDLEANGYGIPELAPESLVTLHPGDPGSVGHRGLIAAGTGLGQALLIWDGKIHRPKPVPDYFKMRPISGISSKIQGISSDAQHKGRPQGLPTLKTPSREMPRRRRC